MFIDTLHRVELMNGLSHEMLVYVRMKRNVFVLNSRRLQRLAASNSCEKFRTSSLGGGDNW